MQRKAYLQLEGLDFVQSLAPELFGEDLQHGTEPPRGASAHARTERLGWGWEWGGGRARPPFPQTLIIIIIINKHQTSLFFLRGVVFPSTPPEEPPGPLTAAPPPPAPPGPARPRPPRALPAAGPRRPLGGRGGPRRCRGRASA